MTKGDHLKRIPVKLRRDRQLREKERLDEQSRDQKCSSDYELGDDSHH